MSLYDYVCLTVYACLCETVCLSLTKGFVLCSLHITESITERKNEGQFTEIFNGVLQGIKSLTQTDPHNIQYYKH